MTFSSPFRSVKNHLMTLLMVAATLAVLTPLGIIFIHILKMGASSLSLEFFTQIPKPTGEAGGGMANGLFGSALLIAMAGCIGLPVGVLGLTTYRPFPHEAVRAQHKVHSPVCPSQRQARRKLPA